MYSGLLIILIDQVNNYIGGGGGGGSRGGIQRSPLDSSSIGPLILNACACHDVVMMQLYCTKRYTLFLNIKQCFNYDYFCHMICTLGSSYSRKYFVWIVSFHCHGTAVHSLHTYGGHGNRDAIACIIFQVNWVSLGKIYIALFKVPFVNTCLNILIWHRHHRKNEFPQESHCFYSHPAVWNKKQTIYNYFLIGTLLTKVYMPCTWWMDCNYYSHRMFWTKFVSVDQHNSFLMLIHQQKIWSISNKNGDTEKYILGTMNMKYMDMFLKIHVSIHTLLCVLA